jgi:hypothetical protein
VETVLHADVRAFHELAAPLYGADPVRHTVAVTVLAREAAGHGYGGVGPLMLSIHEGARLAGAALRTPPYPLIVSGVPPVHAAAAAEAVLCADRDLVGASGPRPEAEAFALAWQELTGDTVREVMAQRLYRLDTLTPPAVAGSARLAGEADLPLLARWRYAFAVEATGELRDPDGPEESSRRSLAAGNGDLLWEAGGRPVAWAAASAPVAGMSRIGPVYTPADLRGHGYGSAVTAAASSWARHSGADHVVLFTDLANPVSNAIYQRIGYRPALDAVEFGFRRRHEGPDRPGP